MLRLLFFFVCVCSFADNNNLLIEEEDLGVVVSPKNKSVTVHIHRLTYYTPLKNEWIPSRTLVFTPGSANAKGINGFLVVYAHPTIGVDCRCSISLNGTNTDKLRGVLSLVDFISRGYTVIEPDYAGFYCPYVHPYLVGLPAAQSILNAIKTVRNEWRPNTYSSNVNIFGWSQGGGVILWTQYYAPIFAPELTIPIAGSIAPPTNLVDLIAVNLKSIEGRYLAILGIYSWSNYYDQTLSMRQLVSPTVLNKVNRIAQVCLLKPPRENLELINLLTLGSKWLIADPTKDPNWRKYMEENSPIREIGRGTKLLVFQGKADALIAWNVTKQWVEQITNNDGNNVEFYLEDKKTHRTILPQAMQTIIQQIVENTQN